MINKWILSAAKVAFFSFAFSSCQGNKVDSTEITPMTPLTEATTLASTTSKTFLNIPIDSLEKKDFTIKSGEFIGGILSKYNVSAQRIDSISKQDIFDVTRIKAGNSYTILTKPNEDTAQYFVYQANKQTSIVFDLRDSLNVYEHKKPIFYRSKAASGTITSSLWNAIANEGLDTDLSNDLAEIFAWQIDFFGIGKGDSFKVIYDEAVLDDSTSLYVDKIKGAMFTHHGVEYYAIPYSQDGQLSFFDEKGQSLRKAFLKAPLKYSRISSGFSNARRHPILKIVRPHHGIDYAAPTGTPVSSIGDGTVITKAYQRGGAGYYLKVKHRNGYVTTYMHLSKYAKNIQVGSKVKQGEVIGFVGSTGASTGPHLDFRVHLDGKPINPLKMESPASVPIAADQKVAFEQQKEEIIKQLKALS